MRTIYTAAEKKEWIKNKDIIVKMWEVADLDIKIGSDFPVHVKRGVDFAPTLLPKIFEELLLAMKALHEWGEL